MATGSTLPGQPQEGQRGNVILEGYFWHEKQTASDKIIKVLPKFNRTNRLKIVLRPFDIFSKKFEERYFVLRNTPAGELPTREDSVKVIEIYDRETDFSKNSKYDDQFLLENLYHAHRHDTDQKDRPNSLNHSLTLYFRDEIKIRKVEMWFRKDDKAKRNQWAQEIQDHRFMIQEEVQAALQEHRTDSNRANVPYYRLADSSPENRSSFFPEVIFTGLTCPGIEGSYQRKAIEDKMAEFTKGLKPGHKYHIHINERTGQHPKWRNQALFYDIEFLNSKGERIFSFDSTSFLTSGTFEGVDFFNLYGFNLKENFFESPRRGDKRNNGRLYEFSRYEFEIQLPSDEALRRFRTKIDNLQKVNRDNKNNATMGKQSEYRDRRHTAPAGERPIRKPTSTLNKADNITTGPAIYPTDTDANSAGPVRRRNDTEPSRGTSTSPINMMNPHSIDEVIETGPESSKPSNQPTTILESIQEPMETNYTNFGAGRSTDRSINPFPPGQVTVRGILQMDDQVDFHCAQDDVNYADSTA